MKKLMLLSIMFFPSCHLFSPNTFREWKTENLNVIECYGIVTDSVIIVVTEKKTYTLRDIVALGCGASTIREAKFSSGDYICTSRHMCHPILEAIENAK